jgi:hypothetical protein
MSALLDIQVSRQSVVYAYISFSLTSARVLSLSPCLFLSDSFFLLHACDSSGFSASRDTCLVLHCEGAMLDCQEHPEISLKDGKISIVTCKDLDRATF